MPTTAPKRVMAWHMHSTFFTFLHTHNRGFFVQHMRNVGVTQNAHTPRPKVTSLSTSCRSSSSFSPFAGRPLMPGEGASRTPRTATPCRASRQTTRRNPGRTWSRCSRSPSMLRPRTRTGPAPAGSLSCVRVCSAEVLGGGNLNDCRDCPIERPRLFGHQPGAFAVMVSVAQSFGCLFLSGRESRTLDRFFANRKLEEHNYFVPPLFQVFETTGRLLSRYWFQYPF